MTVIATTDLTEVSLDGTGIFDVLMRANKEHLQTEFDKNRIRGPEYATVYLGALEATMQTALAFLLQKEKAGLEADLLTAQIALTNQGLLKEIEETSLLTKQVALADQALLKAIEDTALVTQQVANAVLEGAVLVAQECKLRAEYDLLLQQTLKAAQETALLTQKVATEKAQTTALGVDDNSVIGKQKTLYQAQTDGFARDAEQKATKIMVDSWNVRRTTDEATVADGVNMLHDAAVGRAVNQLLGGVGA